MLQRRFPDLTASKKYLIFQVNQELRYYNDKSRKLDQEMNALKPEVKY
jgi:hypothetical protein